MLHASHMTCIFFGSPSARSTASYASSSDTLYSWMSSAAMTSSSIEGSGPKEEEPPPAAEEAWEAWEGPSRLLPSEERWLLVLAGPSPGWNEGIDCVWLGGGLRRAGSGEELGGGFGVAARAKRRGGSARQLRRAWLHALPAPTWRTAKAAGRSTCAASRP